MMAWVGFAGPAVAQGLGVRPGATGVRVGSSTAVAVGVRDGRRVAWRVPVAAVTVCVGTRVCAIVGPMDVAVAVGVLVAWPPRPAASRGWAFAAGLVCVAVKAVCPPLPAGNAVGSTTVGVLSDAGVTVVVACRRIGNGELVGEDCPTSEPPWDCG